MSSSCLTLLALSALGALAAGADANAQPQQTLTTSLLFPVEEVSTVYGSVVSAGPEATTYALHCGEGVDNVQCRILQTQTVVQGPSTLSIQYYYSGDAATAHFFSEDLSCDIDYPRNAATCRAQIKTTNSAGETQSTSLVTSASDLTELYRPAVLTQGVEMLSQGKSGSDASTITTTTTTTAMASGSASQKQSESEAAATVSATVVPVAAAAGQNSALGLLAFLGVFVAA